MGVWDWNLAVRFMGTDLFTIKQHYPVAPFQHHDLEVRTCVGGGTS